MCGAERTMPFVYRIIKWDFPLTAAAYAPGCAYGGVMNDNLTTGTVRAGYALDTSRVRSWKIPLPGYWQRATAR